jgi:hypothetical protein
MTAAMPLDGEIWWLSVTMGEAVAAAHMILFLVLLAPLVWQLAGAPAAALSAALRFVRRLDEDEALFQSLLLREAEFDEMREDFEHHIDLLVDAEDTLARIAGLVKSGHLRDAIHECERAYEEINGGPVPKSAAARETVRAAEDRRAA